MTTIPRLTQQEHLEAIGRYLPSGPVFCGVFDVDSILHKFISGVAALFKEKSDQISTFQDDFFPDSETVFLENWERALGIPDDCFSALGTPAQRRQDIAVKILAKKAENLDDVQQIASIYGLTVTYRHDDLPTTKERAAAGFPWAFPKPFVNVRRAQFTVYVSITGAVDEAAFPWSFPQPFFSLAAVLRCLIIKITGVHYRVIFE